MAEKQSGFIKGRNIGQNVLDCQDLLKHYGRSNCKPSCIIQMDIRKAYDTLDYDFLEEMLEAYGFPSKFIKLIMVCVKTPKFSLLINGMLHGFFSSNRGLRHGDPISPLLFVLCMEYLNRILTKVARHENFRFHDRCSDLQLTHMCFADDVILFTHGDFMSIYLMLQGVELFSKSSGLQINNSKTEIICRGMANEEIQRVLHVSKFREGSLPIKYLGIPINSKGISAVDCASIVDKMLLRSVKSICKAFLWKGAKEFDGAGNVAWEDVCKSKAKGGLGIRDVDLWNIAAIGKYVWAVAKNKESLWVKWVHSVYLKGTSWWTYESSATASWQWKKIVAVKNKLKSLYSLQTFCETEYSVRKVYWKLKENENSVKLSWTRVIWSAHNVPKYSFIAWLAQLNRLKTRKRLFQHGVIDDPNCLICGEGEEDIYHLFFGCCYSNSCLAKISEWLGWSTSDRTLNGLLRWLKGVSQVRKRVYSMTLIAAVYQIWKVRNFAL
ncbi:uncharacterized protein LOC133814037 [Humulus lupulus]|uniref:uncharacterized protein LOC133814037 n=1 Tax=Humulus lupulus TaxID=3486 RepID=UPI002B405BEB|nr:uncharacterized protein LOC133814037 [Humulus lupulus]